LFVRIYDICVFLQITAAFIFRCSCSTELLFKEAAASSVPFFDEHVTFIFSVEVGKAGHAADFVEKWE
jgi:hypothetical protein